MSIHQCKNLRTALQRKLLGMCLVSVPEQDEVAVCLKEAHVCIRPCHGLLYGRSQKYMPVSARNGPHLQDSTGVRLTPGALAMAKQTVRITVPV